MRFHDVDPSPVTCNGCRKCDDFEVTQWPADPPRGQGNYADRVELSCNRCGHKWGDSPKTLIDHDAYQRSWIRKPKQ